MLSGDNNRSTFQNTGLSVRISVQQFEKELRTGGAIKGITDSLDGRYLDNISRGQDHRNEASSPECGDTFCI